MHGSLQTCPRTIGTGFMDDKDASRTITMGFINRFVVSHSTREFMERDSLMDESLYKGHLAWLLLIHILHFNEDTSIFGTLQHVLYIYDIFRWPICSKMF